MTGPAPAGFVAALDRAGWWVPGVGEAVDPAAARLPARTLEELLETAVRLDARQVWVYPDADLPIPADVNGLAGIGAWSTSGSTASWGAPVWIWAQRDGLAVEVSLLHDDPRRHPWAGLQPAHLLGELDAFTDALGARWSCSGAITSDRWLRAHYRAPGGLRLAPSAVPDVEVSTSGPAAMRHWSRPLGFGERDETWIHAFDVNAMFLAAASSLALPTGDAIHHDFPEPNPKVPAWWRLDGREDWIPSPTLELALQRGAITQAGGGDLLREAWIWPEHHRWLEPWYRALRIARGRLEPGSTAARALKQVYSAGVARMGSLNRRSGANDPLYQPYWGAAVRAEANARLERKLHRIRDHHGRTPFCLDVDCSYWTTNEPDPDAFAESIGLALDNQLGHFKHAGTWPAAALADAQAAGATTWHQITDALRKVKA